MKIHIKVRKDTEMDIRKFYFPEKDIHIFEYVKIFKSFPIPLHLKYLVYLSVVCQCKYLNPIHIYMTLAFNNFYFAVYF